MHYAIIHVTFDSVESVRCQLLSRTSCAGLWYVVDFTGTVDSEIPIQTAPIICCADLCYSTQNIDCPACTR